MIIETVDQVTLIIRPAAADRTLMQVTFAASGHQCHFASTKIHCLVTGTGCKQVVSCCAAVPDQEMNP